jgi:hypothetical protein
MPEDAMSKSEGMPEVFLKPPISNPWHPLVYRTLDMTIIVYLAFSTVAL